MQVNHLHQIAQRVQDMDRAVTFYSNVLGLRLIARFDPPGLAFFDLGATRLLLDQGAPSALLYLRVDNIVEETDRLKEAGALWESDPSVVYVDESGQFGPPGEAEIMSFFRDSESNLLALVERRVLGQD